jgi:DNA-binding NtrC family response regulator
MAKMPVRNLHETDSEKRIVVLAVSPREEDQHALRAACAHTTWNVFTTKTIAETLDLLRRKFVPVILCERDLPDGNWTDLQESLAGFDPAPALVVTTRNADDYLWAEVLNLGGYDVLARPFKLRELVRVVSLAWHQWHDGALATFAVG